MNFILIVFTLMWTRIYNASQTGLMSFEVWKGPKLRNINEWSSHNSLICNKMFHVAEAKIIRYGD